MSLEAQPPNEAYFAYLADPANTTLQRLYHENLYMKIVQEVKQRVSSEFKAAALRCCGSLLVLGENYGR